MLWQPLFKAVVFFSSSSKPGAARERRERKRFGREREARLGIVKEGRSAIESMTPTQQRNRRRFNAQARSLHEACGVEPPEEFRVRGVMPQPQHVPRLVPRILPPKARHVPQVVPRRIRSRSPPPLVRTPPPPPPPPARGIGRPRPPSHPPASSRLAGPRPPSHPPASVRPAGPRPPSHPPPPLPPSEAMLYRFGGGPEQ